MVFEVPSYNQGGQQDFALGFEVPAYGQQDQAYPTDPMQMEPDPLTLSYQEFLEQNPDQSLGTVEGALSYAAYRGGRYLDNLQYGLQSIPSIILDFMGNSTEGINKLNDWLVDKTGIGTPSEETIMYAFQKWADETGFELRPDERLAPDDVFGKVLSGIGSAPGIIATAAPFVALRGPAVGFGIYEALHASPEGPGNTAIGFAKGYAFGSVLQRLAPGWKGAPGAMAAGAGMAAIDPETRNAEDITASALTLGILHGSLSRTHRYGTRDFDKSKLNPIKSDYLDPINIAKDLTKLHPEGTQAPKTPTTGPALSQAADRYAQLRKDMDFIRKGLRRKWIEDPVTGERIRITEETKKLYRQQLAELRPRVRDAQERLDEYRLANKLEFSLAQNKERAKMLAEMRGTRPEDEYGRLTGHFSSEDVLGRIKMQSEDAVEGHPTVGLSHYSNAESLANAMVRAEGTKFVPVFKDLSNKLNWDKIKGNIFPPQFLADTNPLIRYVVTKSHERLANISYLKDYFLYRAKWKDPDMLFAPDFARRENSSKGAKTLWETVLSQKEKTRVRNAIFEAQRAVDRAPDKFRVTQEWLESQGLKTRKEIETFHSIRDNLELAAEYARHIGSVYGGPLEVALANLPTIPLYFPMTYKGSFRVFVNRKGSGKNEIALGAETKAEALSYYRQLNKNLDPSKYTVSWQRLKGKHTFDMPLQAFSEAIYRLGASTNEAKILSQVLNEVLAKRGYRAHLTHRKARSKGGSGENVDLIKKSDRRANKEFEEALDIYFEGLAKMVENTVFDVEIAKLNSKFSRLKKHYPNSLEYINSLRSHVMGQEGAITKFFNRGFAKWLSDGGVDNFIRSYILRPTMIWKLHNPKFLASQLLQPYMVTPSRLYNLKAQGYKANVWDAIIEGHREFYKPSKEAIDALRYAADTNAIIPSFALEIIRTAEGFQKAGTRLSKAKDVAILRTAVELAEENSRTLSFLQIYRYMRNAGVKPEQARKDAAYLTKKTMVDYAMHERPMIFGPSKLGTIGLPIGQFKTFQMNYFAQTFEHLATSWSMKDARPIATWMASQVFMAGVYGMMTLEEVDLLISMANKFFKLQLPTPGHFIMSNPEFFPQWLAKGFPSYYMGFDATTTLAAPGFSLGDLASLPGYEWAYDITKAGAQLLSPLNQSVDKQMAFWMRIAPSALQPAVEQYFTAKAAGAATGLDHWKKVIRGEFDNTMFDMERIGTRPIPDWRKGGRGTVIRDTSGEWFSRWFGSRPTGEARMMDDFFMTQRLSKDIQDYEAALVAMWADLTMRQLDKPEWLKDTVIEHYAKRDPAGMAKFHEKVIAKMRSMQSTMYQRLFESGLLSKKGFEQAKKHFLDEQEDIRD